MIQLRYHLVWGSQTTYSVGRLNRKPWASKSLQDSSCLRHTTALTARGIWVLEKQLQDFSFLLSPRSLLAQSNGRTKSRHGLHTLLLTVGLQMALEESPVRGNSRTASAKYDPRTILGVLDHFCPKTPRYPSAMPTVRVVVGKETACVIPSYYRTLLWVLLPDFTVKIKPGLSRKILQTFKGSL